MVDFLLFGFASVGMTLILVNGSIFLPLRESLSRGVEKLHRRREQKGLPPSFTLLEFFHGMIHCVQCMGFWSGLFCGLFLLTTETSYLEQGGPIMIFNRLLMLLCCGTASSFLSMLSDLFLSWLFVSKLYLERQLSFDHVPNHDEPSYDEPEHDEPQQTDSEQQTEA